MIALLSVALLQTPAQACHEAPTGLKAECAREVVAAAEARVSGTVYCYQPDGPQTRPYCLPEPRVASPSGPAIPEPGLQKADCNMSLTGEYLLVCGALNLAREERRMFRYLEIAERHILSGEEPDESVLLAGTRSLSALTDSQRAWRSYVMLACDRFEEMGDMAQISSLGCRMQLTRERTHTIWRHYLSSAWECDPEAPEPAELVIDEIIVRLWPSEGAGGPAEDAWCRPAPCLATACGT